MFLPTFIHINDFLAAVFSAVLAWAAVIFLGTKILLTADFVCDLSQIVEAYVTGKVFVFVIQDFETPLMPVISGIENLAIEMVVVMADFL